MRRPSLWARRISWLVLIWAASVEAPAVFGPMGEFFASSRLDNLSSVHAGLVGTNAVEQRGAAATLAAVLDEAQGPVQRRPTAPTTAVTSVTPRQDSPNSTRRRASCASWSDSASSRRVSITRALTSSSTRVNAIDSTRMSIYSSRSRAW